MDFESTLSPRDNSVSSAAMSLVWIAERKQLARSDEQSVKSFRAGMADARNRL
jgi:hypothetical protein